MKRMYFDIEKAKISLNWQETGKYREKDFRGQTDETSWILGYQVFWPTTGYIKTTQSVG